MKKRVALILFLLLQVILAGAKDTVLVLQAKDTLIVKVDSANIEKEHAPQNLLDSLRHPEMLRKFFFLQEQIHGNVIQFQHPDQVRDLPHLKAIRLRTLHEDNWKFWILLLTILFLALIRLMNVKRFDEILLSAFDLHADFSKYSDKSGNYFMSNLGLFLNFILSLSLFLTNLFEINHVVESDNYYLLFWQFSLVLLLFYIGKVLLNLILGGIFKLSSLSTITLINAIVVNNILGVALVFLNLFFVFVSDPFTSNIISALIFIIILISVIYRQIKNLMMGPQAGKFQFLYIFLYLCALELLPWLVLFKLFLNSW